MSDISVRAFEMGDWEDVAEIFLAPNCRWGTLQMPYQSRDDIKKKLAEPPPDIHRLVAVLNKEQKVIGILGLHRHRHRRAHAAGIGMSIHDDYQNQGVGSKLLQSAIELAEQWLNLKRLELIVYTDNPRAIHLYEKFNFVIEGTLRNYAFRDGEYVDAYTMARVGE